MQLSPRYGDDPVLRIETSLDDVGTPLIRQRRRFAELLATLDDGQWATATRCEGWSVQDVVAHLVSTNQFWALSIRAGAAGDPTRFLATFDPVATPAQLVESVRSQSKAETLERFLQSNDALADIVSQLDDGSWTALAEAPPGHVSLRAVALHALWDAWVHERDVVIPLGIPPTEEPDEVLAGLQYVAALGPSFAAMTGSDRGGHLEVRATDPDATFVVSAGPQVVVRDGSGPDDALVLAGSAVVLLEALSLRVPLDQPVPDADRWLVAGLAEVFDLAS